MEELRISDSYLGELIDFCTRKAIGKILKKFDLVEDKKLLKAIVKESVYEELREIRYLIRAYNKGEELVFHKFNTNKKTG